MNCRIALAFYSKIWYDYIKENNAVFEGDFMYCDGHIHILHKIDTGPAFVEESVTMLRMMQYRGVRRLVLTPHYNMDRESISVFLSRRQKSYREFLAAVRAAELYKPHCVLTAEVDFMPGISRAAHLEKLLVPHTQYLPIDLPLGRFDKWMMAELAHLMHKRKIHPIICNSERHLIYANDVDAEKLFGLPYTVYQFSWRALTKRELSYRIFRLIQSGKTVIFGSNAHAPVGRAPEDGLLEDNIVRLHGEAVYKSLQLRTNAFFDQAFS